MASFVHLYRINVFTPTGDLHQRYTVTRLTPSQVSDAYRKVPRDQASLTVAPDGTCYVVDPYADGITVWDANGRHINTIQRPLEHGTESYPYHIYRDVKLLSDGNLLCVQKWSPDAPVQILAQNGASISDHDLILRNYYYSGSRMVYDDQFRCPQVIATGANGRFVCDSYHAFSGVGPDQLIYTELNVNEPPFMLMHRYGASDYITVQRYYLPNGIGCDDTQMYVPYIRDVAVGSEVRLKYYIITCARNAVTASLRSSNNTVINDDYYGYELGQHITIPAVTCHGGELYVLDGINDRINVCGLDGEYKRSFGNDRFLAGTYGNMQVMGPYYGHGQLYFGVRTDFYETIGRLLGPTAYGGYPLNLAVRADGWVYVQDYILTTTDNIPPDIIPDQPNPVIWPNGTDLDSVIDTLYGFHHVVYDRGVERDTEPQKYIMYARRKLSELTWETTTLPTLLGDDGRGSRRPTIVILPYGEIHVLAEYDAHIYRTRSTDYGVTWSAREVVV
jgi:hypothetical protein